MTTKGEKLNWTVITKAGTRAKTTHVRAFRWAFEECNVRGWGPVTLIGPDKVKRVIEKF